MACGFKHQRIQGDCACCGVIVLTQAGLGSPIVNHGYHRIHFELADNEPPMPITLCAECITHTWTPELLSAIQQQCIEGWKVSRAEWKPKNFSVVGQHPDFPIQIFEEVNKAK